MLDMLLDNAKSEAEGLTLTATDVQRLFGVCIELIDLCSKATGKIDPALGSVLEYARDEAVSQIYSRRIAMRPDA